MFQLLPPTWRGDPRHIAALGCATQVFRRFLHSGILARDDEKEMARSGANRRVLQFIVGVPNIALRLLDVLRRQLKQGSTEPVLIASETLNNLDKLSGQRIMTKPHQLASLVRRALRFAILMGQRA